jgi:putative transposase
VGRGIRLQIALKQRDRQQIDQLLAGGLQGVRTTLRALALRQLDQRQSTPAVGASLGLSAKAVWQIGKRYLDGGLERALFDAARPGKAPALDPQQQQRIIAVVCSPPPEGRTRWTVRLLTEEVIKRKLVPHVGRETIRVLLESHDLKPWREKNVVRGEVGRGVHPQDGGRAQDIRKASVGTRTGDLRGRKAGGAA